MYRQHNTSITRTKTATTCSRLHRHRKYNKLKTGQKTPQIFIQNKRASSKVRIYSYKLCFDYFQRSTGFEFVNCFRVYETASIVSSDIETTSFQSETTGRHTALSECSSVSRLHVAGRKRPQRRRKQRLQVTLYVYIYVMRNCGPR